MSAAIKRWELTSPAQAAGWCDWMMTETQKSKPITLAADTAQ